MFEVNLRLSFEFSLIITGFRISCAVLPYVCGRRVFIFMMSQFLFVSFWVFYPNTQIKGTSFSIILPSQFPLSSQYKITTYFPSFDIIIRYRSSFIFCLSFNTLRNIKNPAWYGLGVYKSSLVWLKGI